MKKFIYNVLQFLRIDWVDTLILNFTKLPIRQAIKIPILLYKTKINYFGGGGIRIDASDISFGMIKLGIKHEPGILSKGFRLENYGLLIFKGAGVLGNGSVLVVKRGGTVTLGRNFGITGDFVLHCHKSVVVGDNFSSSWNVTICDTDFHEYRNAETREEMPVAKQVVIGNNVWLCQRVLVLKGAIIPNWCTIGAMSLVNKEYDCPAYSVIAGAPGKVLERKIVRSDLAAINKHENWKITRGLQIFNNPFVE